MKNEIKDWLLYADRDLMGAKTLLESSKSLINLAAFHCQQAVEKYFKAYLLENDWELEKTHDLIKLNKEIIKIKDLNFDKNVLSRINKIYAGSKYPGGLGLLPDGMPSEEEILSFYEFAKEVKQKINNELSKK
jgi:HEPN domain-containing protein